MARLGQHFLTDDTYLERVVDAEELQAVFSEDRRELTEEDADTIISIVSSYL